jgi:hypothetical protein
MVMRNRHDGANTPGWWDDLPPSLKKRFANTPRPDEDDPLLRRVADGEDPTYRPGVARDLSRLAVLFIVVALANLLFLLIALTFLFSDGPPGP